MYQLNGVQREVLCVFNSAPKLQKKASFVSLHSEKKQKVFLHDVSSTKSDVKMIKRYVRKRWKIFADYTTLHGVKEIYKAPRRILKVLWMVVLAACAATMLYQIYKLTRHFLDEPVTTTVTVKNEFYPLPMLLFVAPTGFLLNKEHATGYTGKKLDDDDALLYARSLVVNKSKVPDGFDFEKAKRKFDDFLKANPGMTWHDALDPFVANISPLIKGETNEFRVWQRSMWTVATYFLIEPVNKPSGETELAHDRIDEVMLLFNKLDSLSPDSEIHIPVVVTSYGLLTDALRLEAGYIYKIRFEITSQRRVPMRKKQCKAGITQYVMYDFQKCNETCLIRARHKYAPQKCYNHKPFEWGFFQGSKLMRPCSNGFYNSTGGPYNVELPDELPEWSAQRKKAHQAHQECLRENCQTACEQLSVKFTTTVREFGQNLANKSILYLAWPAPNAVTVYDEALQYTWDGFVGQLGGLIGLWMGASMMSAFEAMYLCCCCCYNVANEEDYPSDNEDEESMYGMGAHNHVTRKDRNARKVRYKHNEGVYGNGVFNLDEMKKTEIWLPRTVRD